MKDYSYFFFSQQKEGDVNIVGYGYETFERRKIFSPLHIIKHFSIHFVTKGEGTLYIEDKSYPLKKGALFLCPANKRMAYHTSKTNPYTYYWINFSGNKAQDILKALNLSENNPVIYPDHAEDIKQTFHELVSKSQTSSEYLALSALYRVAHLVQNKNTTVVTTTKVYCDQIVEYIKLNYPNSDLKISHIADVLHLSPQYMSKIFKEEHGESIVSYLISYRLNTARELLLSGATVSEASFKVGYDDLSNFSKTYKKLFGVPPSETIR